MLNGFPAVDVRHIDTARSEMETAYHEAVASLNIVAGRPGLKTHPSIHDYHQARLALRRVVDVLAVQYLSV